MREILVALDIQAFAGGEAVLLAMPAGGGQVVALTPEAARNGYYERWLEGWKPDDAPFPDEGDTQ